MRAQRLVVVVSSLLILTASIAAAPPRVEVDAETLARYVGRYELAEGIEFDVGVIDGSR